MDSMDSNKRDKLIGIGYEVKKSCGLCAYGKFTPGNDFGACHDNVYIHQKHDPPIRHLSIVKFGSCPKFRLDLKKTAFLHNFSEFLEK